MQKHEGRPVKTFSHQEQRKHVDYSVPDYAPPGPNLNIGASKTPRDYVTLLCCGRMLQFTRPEVNYVSNL